MRNAGGRHSTTACVLFMCVGLCVSAGVSVCVSACLRVCLAVGLCVCVSVFVSVCRCIGVVACRFVCLSVCVGVFVFVFVLGFSGSCRLAAWSSGMILGLGPRGPGFNSRSGPSAHHACSIVCGSLVFGCVVAIGRLGAPSLRHFARVV